MDYSCFEYTANASGDVCIANCTASERELVVPERIHGHPVTALGAESFARLDKLERIVLPAPLRKIEERAFAGCRNLKTITLNEGLASIGDGAFTNTALQALELPASCTRLSPRSLVIGPAPAGQPVRAHQSRLGRIAVADGNATLLVQGNALCRRKGSSLEALLAPAHVREVRLPRNVSTVLEGAFAGTRELGMLHLHENLRYEGAFGLLPHGSCKRLVIDLDQAIDGFPRIDIEVPGGNVGRDFLARAFSGGLVDCPLLMHAYDEALDALPASHEKACLVAARLARPVFLDTGMRHAFERFAHGSLGVICASFGARNHLCGFDALVSAGILDLTNISDAVSALAQCGDTAAAGRLLELKHARFGKATLDYAL